MLGVDLFHLHEWFQNPRFDKQESFGNMEIMHGKIIIHSHLALEGLTNCSVGVGWGGMGGVAKQCLDIDCAEAAAALLSSCGHTLLVSYIWDAAAGKRW